jgi:hypothetical protein
MTATFHHGEWATTRAGAVTLVQHASGWLIAHTDGEQHTEVITPGEDSYWCDWSPVDGIAQVPDLMAALAEWVAEYAKPLGLPGLDQHDPEPDDPEPDDPEPDDPEPETDLERT